MAVYLRDSKVAENKLMLIRENELGAIVLMDSADFIKISKKN